MKVKCEKCADTGKCPTCNPQEKILGSQTKDGVSLSHLEHMAGEPPVTYIRPDQFALPKKSSMPAFARRNPVA